MSEKKNNVNIVSQWSEKKALSKKLAEKMFLCCPTKSKRAKRIDHCSDFFGLAKCEECGKEYVCYVELCRDRVCPICQWRLARKRAFEMLSCLDVMNESGDYRYQFLTLTQKNVDVFSLRNELKRMNKAWNSLMSSNKKNKPAGCARVTEITYNEKSMTFHPHMHVIIAWEGCQSPYKRVEWQDKWKRSMRLNYVPICRLQVVKPSKEQVRCTKAVLETFKYSLKATDLLKMPDDIFDLFLNGISRTRVCSYTGIFRKTRQNLNLNEDTEIETDDEQEMQCNNCGAQLVHTVYRWSFADGSYQERTVLRDS